MAHRGFAKGGGTTGSLGFETTLPVVPPSKGVWGHRPQPPTNFYGFHIKKNIHFSTLFFIETGHAVRAVNMDNTKTFWQLMSKSRSLAKISEKRLQSLLV